MNRSQLIQRVARNTNGNLERTTKVIEETIRIIAETLQSGEDVALHGLGQFKLTTQAPRKQHNVNTGKWFSVPAKRVIKFEASAKLKQHVSKLPID